MDRIQRLPFLLGLSMSIIIGIISYYNGTEIKEIYLRMFIALVIFSIIGLVARNNILKVKNEVDEKLREEELERLQREAEDKLKEKQAKKQEKGQNVDFSVDNKVIDKDEYMTDSLTKAISSQLGNEE